jgi:alginate O-acetyltransferase complex protein AlgI
VLFNSPEFLFYFLPTALDVLHGLRRWSMDAAIWSLIGCSLYFYGCWNWSQSWIMFTSIPVNYGLGIWIGRTRPARAPLLIGVGANLALLAWFKYSKFFTSVVVGSTNVPTVVRELVLPLAISFFTFQQLAYLVDVWRCRLRDTSFRKYAFFVTFFPQLIAGPIVRYQDIDAQVDRLCGKRRSYASSLTIGVFFLAIGLFKKLYLADTIGRFVPIFFDRAAIFRDISTADAWLGVTCYTLQLYFDFSGYSDMAVGLGRLFGFIIPLNFYSPYKAASIVEFWRRWHITLSRFFQEYLYVPLGGNRRGLSRSCSNLLLVMTLAGLWHGAGWTFVVWGFYHGLLLSANHLWIALPKPDVSLAVAAAGHVAGRVATLLAVMIGWTIFRADSLKTARVFLRSMFRYHEFEPSLQSSGLYAYATGLCLVLGATVLLMPNSAEWIGSVRHLRGSVGKLRRGVLGVFNRRSAGRMSWGNVVVVASMFYFAFTALRAANSEFLYFNF